MIHALKVIELQMGSRIFVNIEALNIVLPTFKASIVFAAKIKL